MTYVNSAAASCFRAGRMSAGLVPLLLATCSQALAASPTSITSDALLTDWNRGGLAQVDVLTDARGADLSFGVRSPKEQSASDLPLMVAAAANLTVAVGAHSFAWLVASLAVAGLCNAGCQTAVNLALARAGLPRLGLAIAIKQSGMPAAAMLSGLAVPAIAPDIEASPLPRGGPAAVD